MRVLSVVFITSGLLIYLFDNVIPTQDVAGWESDDYYNGSGEDEIAETDLSSNPPAIYKLEKFLMRHYNSRLIPRHNPNKPVRVKFRINLYQIVELNEPQQFLVLNSWIVESWNDDFLWWDPARFENITEIILPHDALWNPDTTLYNSIVMDDSETRRLQSIKVTTDPARKTTIVELLYPTLNKFSCTLNLRLFPFDVQHCTMTFGSWTHDNKGIDYYPDNTTTAAIGTENCIENEGWNIVNTDVLRIEKKYTCCPNNYTLLEFGVHIQRKPLYYLVNLIAPTGIITLISIVGFFTSSTINEMREEKITLGITTLLSMSILIFMVSDKMPSTASFIPLIGWFYTCMMLLIAFATLCSSFVINVQKKGIVGQRPSTSTMRWARRLGKLIWLEMPLLMKQAYALKAKALKNKWRFVSMFKAKRRRDPKISVDSYDELPIFAEQSKQSIFQEKLLKQQQRKASTFHKAWKKISRPTSIGGSTLSTILPASTLGISNALSDSASMFGGIGRVAARRPSALNLNPNSNGTELMNLSMDDEVDMDKISEDEEEWDSPLHVPRSPISLGIPNGGPTWPPMLTSERVAKRSPSKLSVPDSMCGMNSNSMRQRKHRPTIADVTLDGMNDPLLNSPSAVNQRNLAEIEYDWLAAVVERLFLCLFMLLFFFMSVGINCIGGYYWLFVTIDKVDE